MSGVGFDPAQAGEWARLGAAVLFTGVAVRLMDDFLDLRFDVCEGAETLAVRLGEGSIAYALISFALGAMVHPEAAVALMVGAYAVGMAGDIGRRLPSGLSGYQESAVLLLLAALFLPWRTLLWAVASMLCVQLLDDLEDLALDRITGNPNLARRIGVVEAHMLALVALLTAALAHPAGTAAVFVATALIGWGCQAALGRSGSRWRRWAR